MSLLSRFARSVVGNRRPEPAATVAIPSLGAFEGPVYAVGDVHGCLALYREIETAILRDAAGIEGRPTLIVLGDMVDRGPYSADVIDHLLCPPPEPLRRICLAGNHEAMLLDYLADPSAHADWLYLGGHETLLSYGLGLDVATLERMGDRKLAQTIAAHVPQTHLSFLHTLLPGLQIGGYLFAHAGADSTCPMTAQPIKALLWGDADRTAPAGLTLVHGHFVTPEPERRANSIGIDTGAYATGRLTALRLVPGRPPAALSTKQDGTFSDLALCE